MKIKSGDLDRKLVIQSSATTLDSETNQEVTTWSTFARIWGQKVKNGSKEQYEARQQVAVSDVRYLIRHLLGVTEKMRVVDGDNTYEIKGIEDAGRKNALILSVEKRDNG